MSYESDRGYGLTELELAAGVQSLISGKCGRSCLCASCENVDCDKFDEEKVRSSAKYKYAAKLIAGLNDKKRIKLALIQRLHHDHLDSAVVRYMKKEALPTYYASIVKSPDCIVKLVEGILYKVCKITPERDASAQIRGLSQSLQRNMKRRTAYDRVSEIQQLIHRILDLRLGVGAARSIPVIPMKNALSAARLHLHIFDVVNRRPEYVEDIENLSEEAMRLEYKYPRPPTAPWGKLPQRRWRVRHLRPFSYYLPENSRSLISQLRDLPEGTPLDLFFHEAAWLYARS